MSFQQELQINQTADAKRSPLPCLNSNNCIDTENPNQNNTKQTPFFTKNSPKRTKI